MTRQRILLAAAMMALASCRANDTGKDAIGVGPYLQKIQTTITSATPGSGLPSNDVRDLLVTEEGKMYIATAGGLVSTYDGGGWIPYNDAAAGADNALLLLARDTQGRVWAATATGIKLLDAGAWTVYSITTTTLTGTITALRGASDGGLWVGTTAGYAHFDGTAFSVKSVDNITTTSLMEDSTGSLWRGTPQGVQVSGPSGSRTYSSSSGLLSDTVRAVEKSPTGQILVGTNKGISRFDPVSSTWTQITGTAGLPFTDIVRIAFTADKELFVATTWGAALQAADRWHYFAGKRWIPSDTVTAVAGGPGKTLWMATPAGIGKVDRVITTLAEKAAHYEEQTRARHVRMGMVESVHLAAPGDLEHFTRHDADNDGLWTQMYVAAESFRYAVTKDPEAKRNARESIDAMLKLEQFPRELGNPGFIARSFVSMEEVAAWHPGCAATATTADEMCWCQGRWWMAETSTWKGFYPDASGRFCYKTDTSSDEITGHMFGYAVYYDLVAEGEEKDRIRAVVSRLMNHIVGNGFRLIDFNGMPTTFGRWDPEKIDSDMVKVNVDGKWVDQGTHWMDALEILSYLTGAYHITGEKIFLDGYWDLVKNHQYDKKAAVWQRVFSISPQLYNYSDDELAFLAYYPLMAYQHDEGQRKVFLDSIRSVLDIKRPQRNPLWNFIAGVGLQKGYGPEDAARTLMEFPWSFITWTMLNSHRSDIIIALTIDRHNNYNPQSTRALPYDERIIEKWNSNPYSLDEYGGGWAEEAATPWLLPYWMGRYYGFIVE